MLPLLLPVLLPLAAAQSVPVVLWHGMGDSAAGMVGGIMLFISDLFPRRRLASKIS